eukprot:SAG31_NODE_3521_length_4163_cov_4.411663_2_plen_289_part_00
MNGSPLLLALLLAAAAAPQCILAAETAPHEARCASAEIAAASVRRATRRLCDSQPIADALASVLLGDDAVASTAADLLSNTLGIRTALDLQLLEVGGPEATELFDSLKAGGMTVGARAKIRLLLQRGSEGGHTAQQQPPDQAPHLRDVLNTGGSLHSEGDAVHRGRVLQEDSSDGMSVDAIAIVLSVLVGGAGYVMQVGRPPCCFSARLFRLISECRVTSSGHHCEACGARAAGLGPPESLCRVRDTRSVRDKRPLVLISSIMLGRMRRQREHEQMVAQIKRTDRAQF